MGTSLSRRETFCGVPLVVVRDFVRRVCHARSLNSLAATKKVSMALPVAIALANELERQGFLSRVPRGTESPGWMDTAFLPGRRWTTSSGNALTRVSFLPRCRPPEAWSRLLPILERARDWNADPAAGRAIRVERIWVFGSLVKESETVGDVDIVIETRIPDAMEGWIAGLSLDERRTFVDANTAPGVFDRFDGVDVRVLLLEMVRLRVRGARRDPFVNETDIGTLVAMAEPCGLVFDDERGIDLAAPTLVRHPDAGTRCEDLDPPLTMPRIEVGDEPAPLDLSGVDAAALLAMARRYGSDGSGRLVCRSRDLIRDWLPQRRKAPDNLSEDPNEFLVTESPGVEIVGRLRMSQEWRTVDRVSSTVLHPDLDGEFQIERSDAVPMALLVAVAVSSLVQAAIRFANVASVRIDVEVANSVPQVLVDVLRRLKSEPPLIFVEGPGPEPRHGSRVAPIDPGKLRLEVRRP